MKKFFKRLQPSKHELLKDEILWIPGEWKERSEFVKSIAIDSFNEYLFMGFIMMNMNTNESFGIQILNKSDFENLDFLGDFKNLEIFIRLDLSESQYSDSSSVYKAVKAILKSGGKSILTEKTGLIYSPEHWDIVFTSS